jgi:hypothetical protein
LHLREQEAEYEGTDGTDRKRNKPNNFRNMLQDVHIYLLIRSLRLFIQMLTAN